MTKSTCFILIIIACFSFACTGGKPWTLVEVLTKGNYQRTTAEVIDVRNCAAPERKTTGCSAGTSKSLALSADVTLGWSISAGVNSALGIGSERDQSLALDTPPEGSVFRYTVSTTYSFFAGDMLVRSPSGGTQTHQYTFDASCSLEIKSKAKLTCSEADISPPAQPTPKVLLPALPETVSTAEPVLVVSPVDSILLYWDRVVSGEYDKAWRMLSPGFKRSEFDQGFDEYQNALREWLDTLCLLEVADARLEKETVDAAEVSVTMRFQVGGNCINAFHDFYFYLTRDDSGDWLISLVIQLN